MLSFPMAHTLYEIRNSHYQNSFAGSAIINITLLQTLFFLGVETLLPCKNIFMAGTEEIPSPESKHFLAKVTSNLTLAQEN